LARSPSCTTIEALGEGFDLVVKSVPERMALKAMVLATAERREPRLLADSGQQAR